MLKCKPEARKSQRNVHVIQYDPLYNSNVLQNINDMQTNFVHNIGTFVLNEHIWMRKFDWICWQYLCLLIVPLENYVLFFNINSLMYKDADLINPLHRDNNGMFLINK